MSRVALTSPYALASWNLCKLLLRRGDDVSLLSRSVPRVAPLIEQGAQAVRGDLRDPNTLADLFEGARCAVIVTPSDADPDDQYELEVAQTIARSIHSSSLKHVVYISALGAHAPGDVPHLQTKAEIEALFADTGVPLTVLRPAIMLDFLALTSRALDRGVLALPLDPDHRFHVTTAPDVARASMAAVQRGPEGANAAHEIAGPEPISGAFLADALSKQWGRIIRYRRLDGDAFVAHLQELGVSGRRADVLSRILSAHQEFEITRDTEHAVPEPVTDDVFGFASHLARANKKYDDAILEFDAGALSHHDAEQPVSEMWIA